MKAEYMEALLAQIRGKYAKERVRKEVEDHIEDQKNTYMTEGMPEEEAEERAVADMGDPVDAGTALDLVHRPKPAWKMLAVIALLCIAGAVLQYTVYLHGGGGSAAADDYYFRKQCQHALLGFGALCIVYLADYTRIAKHSRKICAGMLLSAYAMPQIAALEVQVHGTEGRWINVFGLFWISLEAVLYLYVPVCGAALYSYRNAEKKELWKMLPYIAVPLWMAWDIRNFSLALNLAFIFLVMFSAAVRKDWYHLPKKTALGIAWGSFAGISVLPLFTAANESYQKNRIQAWLHPFSNAKGGGYVYTIIRNILSGSRLVGPNTLQPLDGSLPNMQTDYILAYVIGYYGVLAAAALVLLIVMLGVKFLRISVRQKNQLGMMMGLGCSLVFGIQSLEYILVNLGLLPATGIYFPLISFGGSGMLQTCILLGILLSIYRYQDVVPEPAAGRRNAAAQICERER